MNDPLHIGDHVTDRESEDGERMVVVRDSMTLAADVKLSGGTTVAAENPDYPENDMVYHVRYPERPDVRISDGRTYAFPRSRLKRVASVHDEVDS